MRPEFNICEYTSSWYARLKQTTVRFLGMYFDENETAIRVLGIIYEHKAAIRSLDILD